MAAPRKPVKNLLHWGAYTGQKYRMRKAAIALLKNAKLPGEALERQARDLVLSKLVSELRGLKSGKSLRLIEVHNDLMVLQHRMKREGVTLITAKKYADALKRAIANDKHALEVVRGLKHYMAERDLLLFTECYKKDIESLGNELAKVESDIRKRPEGK